MLKDGMKEVIKMNVCAGMVLEFDSINELMLAWYENGRDKIKHEDIIYRGQKIKIVYDVVLDDKGNLEYETDFIDIRKQLERQILNINLEKDGE